MLAEQLGAGELAEYAGEMDSEDALAKVKNVSEGVRGPPARCGKALEDGQPLGQALAFLRDVARRAPRHSSPACWAL
ncbi:hypothetical protein [Bradyrhizobium sp. USDA 4454]